MREPNLERVAAGTTKLNFIRAIGIIRWRSARTPTAKLETAVWATMRSHEGRGVLAIAKKGTLKQNLMVLGGLRNQIRIMPDYPLRRFLPDFGPRPSSWGLSFGAHRFPNAPQPAPSRQPDADQTAPPDEALKLQQPLPDRTLRIVARGVKERRGRAGDVTSEEDEQAAPAGTAILLIAFSVLGSGIITDRFAPEAVDQVHRDG